MLKSLFDTARYLSNVVVGVGAERHGFDVAST